MIAYQPTLSWEDPPASRSASLATGQDSQEHQDSCGSMCEQYELSVLTGLSGKTFQERSQAAEGRITDACSKPWMASGILSHGEYWTRSFSEWPKDADVCTLSAVLEPAVPQRYYLSPKACAGIIKRAKRKGRPLPQRLLEALEAQMQDQTV